jgi:hypothetical protein
MQLFVHQFYTSTTFRTPVFTLVQHVSATLGHHQALLLSLLKLSHCNLAFLYAPLFICLMLFHFCFPLAQVHLTNFISISHSWDGLFTDAVSRCNDTASNCRMISK